MHFTTWSCTIFMLMFWQLSLSLSIQLSYPKSYPLFPTLDLSSLYHLYLCVFMSNYLLLSPPCFTNKQQQKHTNNIYKKCTSICYNTATLNSPMWQHRFVCLQTITNNEHLETLVLNKQKLTIKTSLTPTLHDDVLLLHQSITWNKNCYPLFLNLLCPPPTPSTFARCFARKPVILIRSFVSLLKEWCHWYTNWFIGH